MSSLSSVTIITGAKLIDNIKKSAALYCTTNTHNINNIVVVIPDLPSARYLIGKYEQEITPTLFIVDTQKGITVDGRPGIVNANTVILNNQWHFEIQPQSRGEYPVNGHMVLHVIAQYIMAPDLSNIETYEPTPNDIQNVLNKFTNNSNIVLASDIKPDMTPALLAHLVIMASGLKYNTEQLNTPYNAIIDFRQMLPLCVAGTVLGLKFGLEPRIGELYMRHALHPDPVRFVLAFAQPFMRRHIEYPIVPNAVLGAIEITPDKMRIFCASTIDLDLRPLTVPNDTFTPAHFKNKHGEFDFSLLLAMYIENIDTGNTIDEATHLSVSLNSIWLDVFGQMYDEVMWFDTHLRDVEQRRNRQYEILECLKRQESLVQFVTRFLGQDNLLNTFCRYYILGRGLVRSNPQYGNAIKCIKEHLSIYDKTIKNITRHIALEEEQCRRQHPMHNSAAPPNNATDKTIKGGDGNIASANNPLLGGRSFELASKYVAGNWK